MLSDEKYIGRVHLFRDNEEEGSYVSYNNHPAIISENTFERVQQEKKKRSNVVKNGDKVMRKSRKYSSKV